mgnify:CR=1 FL=1
MIFDGFIFDSAALFSMPAAVPSAVKEVYASTNRATTCGGRPHASPWVRAKSAARFRALIAIERA